MIHASTTHAHTHIHIYTHTHTHSYTHTHIHIRIHMHIQTLIQARTREPITFFLIYMNSYITFIILKNRKINLYTSMKMIKE